MKKQVFIIIACLFLGNLKSIAGQELYYNDEYEYKTKTEQTIENITTKTKETGKNIKSSTTKAVNKTKETGAKVKDATVNIYEDTIDAASNAYQKTDRKSVV